MRWGGCGHERVHRRGRHRHPHDRRAELFASELRFPAAIVADVGRFDRLVNELATRASDRKRARHTDPLEESSSLPPSPMMIEQPSKPPTRFCAISNEPGAQPHLGFYIRNPVAPRLACPAGEPSRRARGEPTVARLPLMSPALQGVFQRRASERKLWMGGARGRTTNRTSRLSSWPGRGALPTAWADVSASSCRGRPLSPDLRRLPERRLLVCERHLPRRLRIRLGILRTSKPGPFPVPCTSFGTRQDKVPSKLPGEGSVWSGRAPRHAGEAGSLETASGTISRAPGEYP